MWDDYLFLTREMVKLLDKQDYDLFFDLLDQRERLQTMINEQADTAYAQSPAGLANMLLIQRENQAMQRKLKMFLNRAKQQQQLTQAYDAYSGIAGNRMDIKK
jgi:hypothetical protein